jgi:putative addiction module killer protein
LEGLKDQRGRTLIKSRLDRVALGNLGDTKSMGGGVSELRIDLGPGYRIYYGKENQDVIVLSGGTKHKQRQDIARAKIYWADYQVRRNA